MPSILPCSQCGGQGCYHCANEALDQIKAIERRSRFTSDEETERRAMTVSILTELAARDGHTFDPTHPNFATAIRLTMDVLQVLSKRRNTSAEVVILDKTRWAMMEFSDAPPLKRASEIDSPVWSKK